MCLSEPRCWSTPTNWLAYQNLGLRRHESGHYVRWNFPWEKIGLVVKNKRLVLELHNPACKYTNSQPSATNPTLYRHRLRPEALHKIKSREVQRHGQTHQGSQRRHGGRLGRRLRLHTRQRCGRSQTGLEKLHGHEQACPRKSILLPRKP